MNQEIIPSASPSNPAIPAIPSSGRHESVEQALYVIFRRKWIILGLLIAFTAAAALAVSNRSPVRRAVAKILLKQDRTSLEISNLSSASAKNPYSAQLMKTELQLIGSRDVLLPVARQLIAEEKGTDPKKISEATLDSRVESLSKSLVVSTVGDSNVIQLEYFAPTVEEAERTLKHIVGQYREHHALAYSGSKQLLTFYEKEKEQARRALEKAEDQHRQWQKENDIVAIDDQITGLLTQHAALRSQLQEVESGATVALDQNPLMNRIQGDLVAARVELNDLLARYTEQDRRVREKKQHIALLQSQLEETRSALMGSRSTQRGSLERQVAETKTALDALREQKLQGERFKRSVDVNRDTFLLYGKKLEEARISNQLARNQLSSLAVIESPYGTTWTDADQRVGTTLLASLTGLTLGVAIAFVLAFFNKSVRTRRDVEAHLGLPVLATIPDLHVTGIPDLREKAA